MARIQILELPEGANDERPPFAVVIDQADEATLAALNETDTPQDKVSRYFGTSVADLLGARAILIFEETIEIPSNYIGLDEFGETIHLKVEPDLTGFSDSVAESIADAQRQARVLMQDMAT
jgi:hypothetical protein